MSNTAGTYTELILDLQGRLLSSYLHPDKDADKKRANQQRKVTNTLLSDKILEFAAIVQPEIVLEIGAHEASFSRSIRTAHPNLRSVAFEANPEVHKRWAEECTAAGVEYIHQCVSNSSEPVTFTVPIYRKSPELSMGSMSVDPKAPRSVSYTIPATTLDDFLGPEGSARSNVMWIDVEGAIRTVLEGMKASLASCRLFYAELETKQRWRGNGAALAPEVINHLADFGLRPILRDLARSWQYNCVFVHESLLGEPAIRALCADYIDRCAAEMKRIAEAPTEIPAQ